MENNKPQWLIDAENEIKNFEESKYGKFTEKQLNISNRSKTYGGVMDYVKNNPEHQKKAFSKILENNPNHQSKAGKIGGAMGGHASWQKLVNEHGEEKAAEIIANRNYNAQTDEWKKDFHSKGAKKSGSYFNVRSCGIIIKGVAAVGVHEKACKCTNITLVKPDDENYQEVLNQYNEIKKIQNKEKVPTNQQKWMLPNGKITSTPWLSRLCKKYGFSKEDCKRVK